jgi:hypothetical protein
MWHALSSASDARPFYSKRHGSCQANSIPLWPVLAAR